MSYRIAATAGVLALLCAAPGLSIAGDLEDVKAVWEQTLKAYNAMDVNGVFANGHQDAVGFGPGAPFPTESQAMARQGLTAFFASAESINVRPINFQFRVFGNTAVAWGFYAATVKMKDGPAQTTFGRLVVTYAKLDGKWVAVSNHNSLMPSGG
jgi:ketosteroid isomerase-like protein